MEQLSFGPWLRRRRKALDLTREGLAERVGCSAATIRKIETEERRPSEQIAGLLADALAIPAGERPAFVRFARGELRSALPGPAGDLPWQSARSGPPSNLAAPVTSFIGRKRETAELAAYLNDAVIRLVTLIGPPGIGKTRLGMEAAREALERFPDGVFFAALAALDDPAQLAPAILRAVGFVEQQDLPALEQLSTGIRNRRILLLLDDCEHLVEPIAALVSDLLAACPRLKVLATSRQALRVPGEWLYAVPPLEAPGDVDALDIGSLDRFPALALFVERARASRPDFVLNDGNVRAVASICARLDGLPLAIELVAVRARLMSPQALQARLGEWPSLPPEEPRPGGARRGEWRAAVRWSYDLLPPDEQRMFACVSVFTGGFTLEAIEFAFADLFAERPAAELVNALLDKSLLQQAADARNEPRFHMLTAIRQFAQDCLTNGDRFRTRDRHLAWCLELAERGQAAIHGPDQTAWIDRLEAEYENFHTALHWGVSAGRTENCVRLLGALGWPWEIRSHYREAQVWFEAIRELPDIADHPAAYARLLNHIGRHSWTRDDLTLARALLEQARAIGESLGEAGRPILAETLNWLGLEILFGEHDPAAAVPLFEQALDLFEACGDPYGIALSLFHLGIGRSSSSNDQETLRLYEHSLALFRRQGDLFNIARISLFLGFLHLGRGDVEQAKAYWQEQLTIDRELMFWDAIAETLRHLGNLHRSLGDLVAAEDCLRESLSIYREHGLTLEQTLFSLGMLALQQDDHDMAAEYFLAYYDQGPFPGTSAMTARLLAGMSAALASDRPEDSARLHGAARGVFARQHVELSPFDQAEIERHLSTVRAGLGEERFEALTAEGQAMEAQLAVGIALRNGPAL